MKIHFRIITCLLLRLLIDVLCILPSANAQDIDKIGKEKPLKISGGISLNQVIYFSNDSIRRRSPYTWVATGNLNFNIYGLVIPFSYTISNYENSYQQPFNQYSIHPVYKWVTLHAGNCSMNFSPYTLSGHTFLGAGVDVAPPGIFKLSFMVGRLLRAIEPDTTNNNIIPAYQRMGFGMKAGIVKGNNTVEFILFKASDNKNSLKELIADSILKPKENLVLSLGGKISPIKNLIINAEVAGSALTDNLNEPTGSENTAGKLYSTTGLFKARSSSMYYKAFKTGLNYTFEKSTIGLLYERIEPGYKTLSTYYSNNDFQNYTVNASTVLFAKINLSLSAGIQQDDLDHKKTSNTQRFVSALNVTYNVNEKLNMNASYSGFQTYTHVRSQFEDINRTNPYEYIDSLNFTQLTNALNTNIAYNFVKSKTKQDYLSVNISYQKASDKQSSKLSGSEFVNTNVSFTHSLIPIGLIATASVNMSHVSAPGAKSITIGPNLAVSKNMLNKTFRPTLSISVNNAYANGIHVNSSMISRLLANYTIKKKHNINFSLAFSTIKNNGTTSTSKRNEFTGTMGYSFNF